MRASGVRRIVAVAGCVVGMVVIVPVAQAAVTIGDVSPGNGTSCASPRTMVQATPPVGKTYVSPIDGVITAFTFEGGGGLLPSTTQTKLLVLEQTGPADYRVVAAGELETTESDVLVTRPARVPIVAGQTIGAWNYSCFRDMPDNGGMFRTLAGPEPPVGSTQTFGGLAPGRMILEATIEPDCDRDGFGDETQDDNLSPCPPAPTATITGGPKDKVKTKKKRAKATFTFSANEPGAVFNCVLDGRQEFKACTSPLTVKVKRGRHTFSVTATDAGGNAGAAASDDWKVKRKKKRR